MDTVFFFPITTIAWQHLSEKSDSLTVNLVHDLVPALPHADLFIQCCTI